MRRPIESTNPFYYWPRFAFGYEHIRHLADGAKLLDYGCNDGSFGRDLRQSKDIQYFGVEKDADAKPVTEGAGFEIHVIENTLPFPDEFFDVATIFEVLEHVQDDVVIAWIVLHGLGLALGMHEDH